MYIALKRVLPWKEFTTMSKAKMLEARRLIEQKRYDDARSILIQVDHPTADKWLAKLDQIAPVREPQSFTIKAVIVLALYWVFWIPGLIANILFLNEARSVAKRTQVRPDGIGCLWWLMIANSVFVSVFVVVGVLILISIAITGSQPSTSPFIYTLF
jgi:hypothetical protein